MSISEKFYQGLTSPLNVTGAQMPVDLVPYAGGPLDALAMHKAKYQQLMQMYRHSELASKRNLATLSDVGADEEYDMDKVGFVGSNPVSRRAFLLQKIANEPVPGSEEPVTSSATFNQPTSQTPPQDTPSPQQPSTYDLGNLGSSPPVTRPEPPPPPPPTAYSQQYNGGASRFVGQGAQDLGDSGDVARRLSELGSAMSRYRERPAIKERDKGFLGRMSDTLEHYGTRAARGLSTAAQMGASKLYDVANRDGYLADDSFIGRNILDQKARESLNREMADINASLYHAYGGRGNQVGSNIYADRYKNLDMDLGAKGVQPLDTNLLDSDTFREDQVRQQMALRQGLPENMRPDFEQGIRDRVNNMYGFTPQGEPNRLGTGRISDDLDGTAFRRAASQAGSRLMTNPSSLVTQTQALETMLSQQPEMYTALKNRFGAEAAEAGIPLASYVANKLSGGLDPSLKLLDEGGEGIEDDLFETDEQRLARYDNTRRITQDILGSMTPDNQAQFINTINPRVVQRAEEISVLMDEDPQRALAEINAMDPMEARFLLDQVSMFSQYISPQTASRVMDYDKYKISEDDENFFGGLFNFGGSDIVNRARQQVGAGGNIDDLTGAARDRVFGYNSMRDVPRGRFYLAEKGNLGDTFFNPETGEVNYELGGDRGNLLSSRPGGFSALPYLSKPLEAIRDYINKGTTYERLPAQYHKQYRDRVGAENSGLRDDYFLVDDGIMGNYYYNPYSGDRNYEFLYGNQNQFQNKPLPQQFHEQYRKQFNRSPSYRG